MKLKGNGRLRNKRMIHCGSDHRTLELELQLLPLKERKRKLARRLEDVRTTSFPSDGIRRFEMISGRLTEMEAKKRGLAAEITAMAGKMGNVHPLKSLQKSNDCLHASRNGMNGGRQSGLSAIIRLN